jgi:hypothetical protein
MPEDLATVAASFSVWTVLFFSAYARPIASVRRWHVGAQYIVALCHAVVAVLGALWVLTEDGAALKHNLYGSTALSRRTIDISLGYFIWDVFVVVLFPVGPLDDDSANKNVVRPATVSPANLAHGGLCMLVYALMHYEFLHHMGAIMLLYEISSIPLNIRLILIERRAATGSLYNLVQGLFALSFVVVRIGVGFPASYSWWQDMLAYLQTGRAHSTAAYLYLLCANILLNGLNLYWAFLIAKKALRSRANKGPIKGE